MLRKAFTAASVLLLVVSTSWSADKEIKGKIVKYDASTRKMTVKAADGEQEVTLGVDAKVLDPKGNASKDGVAEKALASGAEVKLVIPEKGKVVREVTILVLAKKDDKKEDDKPGVAAKLLKVDTAKKTAQAQLADGKKLDLTIGDAVKFFGPQGGARDKGINDECFVVGAEVRLVLEKGALKEVYLPRRDQVPEKK